MKLERSLIEDFFRNLYLRKGGIRLFLYHMVIHNDILENINPQIVLKEGLNYKTSTKWYSKSANLFPDLTERFRPANLPKWIDFEVAFGARFGSRRKSSLSVSSV